MYYENMPLYPSLGPEGDQACVRVPVFGGRRCPPPGRPECGRMPETGNCRRVMIENPCRPGERAEVLLSVDECGNLVVCVRREPCPPRPCRPSLPEPCPPRPCRPCPPEPCPPRPRCDGARGRLYGSWR